jgi:hypothetical protein
MNLAANLKLTHAVRDRGVQRLHPEVPELSDQFL